MRAPLLVRGDGDNLMTGGMTHPDYDEKSVTQRTYEFVLRAGHSVRAREIAAAVGATSLSSVTYALTRLVREGNLQRTGYGEYAAPSETQSVPDTTPLDPFRNDRRLSQIFESIRGSLSFEDLSFLYNVVLSARRLAPDLFRQRAEPQPVPADMTEAGD
jgi:hypothetical protein